MQRGRKVEWSQQESKLLAELVPNFTSKKWKRISEEFRKKGFQRSETECREKWVNFLAPGVNREEWEPWELRTLYEMHARVGTRWCIVQKSLRRSQNQIKNRFYGTLRNFIRAVLAHFDPARMVNNCPVARLSPNYLNALYNSTAEFLFLNGQIREVLWEMGFKVERVQLTARIQERLEVYRELNLILLRDFNSSSQNEPPADPQLAELRMTFGMPWPLLGEQGQQQPAAMFACQPAAFFWFI